MMRIYHQAAARAIIPRRALATLGLVLTLAACSGGTDAPPVELQLVNSVRGVIQSRVAGKPAVSPLTRTLLDEQDVSYLEVVSERRDLTAYLTIGAERHDSGPGRITVWRTADNVSLAMRNGVLIATRGLGGDILSSQVPVRGNEPGPATGGERTYRILARDNKAVRVVLACDRVDLGPETIEIVERRYPTRHLQERCTASDGDVINDYWVDSRAGLVWQSRQWAGPYVGYLRTRRLTVK